MALHVLSPVAPTRTDVRPLAPRLDTLAGRRVALLDNQKANAGALLASVGDRLAARIPSLQLTTERKVATSPSPDGVMARLRTVDAVVLAIAD